MATTLVDIERAHAEAQARFADMVRARSYADPDAPETRAYIAAERLVDDLLANAAWERSQDELAAAMDEGRDGLTRSKHDAECDCHWINREAVKRELALGDHFAGMPS